MLHTGSTVSFTNTILLYLPHTMSVVTFFASSCEQHSVRTMIVAIICPNILTARQIGDEQPIQISAAHAGPDQGNFSSTISCCYQCHNQLVYTPHPVEIKPSHTVSLKPGISLQVQGYHKLSSLYLVEHMWCMNDVCTCVQLQV